MKSSLYCVDDGFNYAGSIEELGSGLVGCEKENYDFTLDDSYEFSSEDEPDYWKIFSSEEISDSFMVSVERWEKDGFVIKRWSREGKGLWVVFSSIEYDRTMRF